MYKSLLETKTNYPFYVAITDGLSKESVDVLKNNNINLIKLDEKIDMPEKIKNKKGAELGESKCYCSSL